MSSPKRIVVVDDEARIRRLVAEVLRAPDFEVTTFADARDALARLPETRPDLIICDVLMPEMDGRGFLKLVKETQDFRDVPFIFLSGIRSNEEIADTLEAGADDFVGKPFHPRRLVAKVQATLRMSARLASVERPQDALAGTVGEAGTLPLLKFCEDSRLTGRLSVESGPEGRWAEFVGGELIKAGGGSGAEDALDALLAVGGGSYRIEQRRLDPRALEEVERRVKEGRTDTAPLPPSDVPLIPGGRLSKIEVRGQSVEVQTEGENRPNFTVTTVIARSGQVLRKIETSWQHPLLRTEDQELARVQIDRQHDRVVATIRELTLEATPRKGTPQERQVVDGSILAWAASFVAEQARDALGSVMTVALLRRTHRRLAREHESLRSFRVSEDGRVLLDAPGGPAVARHAVAAVAAWTAAFVAEASSIVERIGALKVRQATRMMEADLDQMGFYAAFEQATRH
ncbi:MAG: response regulator transcription factor [Acidobacteria bacterium]|nr:response regulator transcription factor [Acidobacteriota bacterium]